MAISGDYASPVTVNGFNCRNCTDVDYARKNIDPAHPKSGPFGVNAATDPSLKQASRTEQADPAAAVTATTGPRRLLDIRV